MLRLLTSAATALLCGCATVGCKSAEPGPNDPQAELICDGEYLDAALSLIDGATDRVLITQFELFSGSATNAIVAAIGDATDRGVTVQVLLDDEIDDNEAGVNALVSRGAEAKVDLFPDITVHSKMLLADGQVALVGSTNWSTSSITRNHECNLRLRNGAPVAYIESWFHDMWADPSQRVEPGVDQSGSPRVRALADDVLLPTLLESVAGARQRVDFTLYGTFLQPTNPSAPASQVYEALATAAERGVPVRGIAEWSDWQFDNNERNEDAVAWLEARGVDMRWESPDVITHAKAFLVDDTLQIQSANISTSGFERNRETGAWTDLAGPVDGFSSWFDTLWAESTDAPGAR